MHKWSVDSIEEFVASVEVDGQTMTQVPLWLLPSAVKEGQILAVKQTPSADGTRSVVEIEIDDPATRAAHLASGEQIEKSLHQKNDPGGDIKL